MFKNQMKFEENGIRYMNMYDVWWDINIYIYILCQGWSSEIINRLKIIYLKQKVKGKY